MAAHPGQDDPGRVDAAAAKRLLRETVRTRRALTDPASRRQADDRRDALLLPWLRNLRPATVAAYVSVDPEPSLAHVIDALVAESIDVLLPVLGRRPDGSPRREPDWEPYAGPGTLRPGLWGIAEPDGVGRGQAALAAADVILLPGLGADLAGHRLGMGGGWYDRALAYARADAPRCVILNDDELVPTLPAESHDRGVTHAATPSGLHPLPGPGFGTGR